MLVLSRQKGERVVIEDEEGNVVGTVILVDHQRNRSRIGFEFPKKYKILREEVVSEEAVIA